MPTYSQTESHYEKKRGIVLSALYDEKVDAQNKSFVIGIGEFNSPQVIMSGLLGLCMHDPTVGLFGDRSDRLEHGLFETPSPGVWFASNSPKLYARGIVVSCIYKSGDPYPECSGKTVLHGDLNAHNILTGNARPFALGAAGIGLFGDFPDTQLQLVVSAFSSSVGPAKNLRRQAVADIVRRSENTASALDAAIRFLLSSNRSGRLNDALDLLNELADVDLLYALLSYAPEITQENIDYWYALIRAAGRAGERLIVDKFIDSPLTDLQAAAVEALCDIADEECVRRLTEIANDQARSALVRDLAEQFLSEQS